MVEDPCHIEEDPPTQSLRRARTHITGRAKTHVGERGKHMETERESERRALGRSEGEGHEEGRLGRGTERSGGFWERQILSVAYI